MNKSLQFNWAKVVLTALFGGYFMYCALHPTGWHLIDNFDLIIHEAGHTIFVFFGEFIHIAMGSGFQILVPLLFSLYFFNRYDYFAGSLLLSLVGYNLVNVSVYAHDAILMQLPLLGGDSVIHDWNTLLTMTNLLPQTYHIASLLYGMGLLTILGSIVLALYFSQE